jgi:hypothetical protein
MVRKKLVILCASLCLFSIFGAAKADEISLHIGGDPNTPVTIDNPMQDGKFFSTCFFVKNGGNACDENYTVQVSAWRICNLIGRANYTSVRWLTRTDTGPVIQFKVTDNGVEETTPTGTGIVSQVSCL